METGAATEIKKRNEVKTKITNEELSSLYLVHTVQPLQKYWTSLIDICTAQTLSTSVMSVLENKSKSTELH